MLEVRAECRECKRKRAECETCEPDHSDREVWACPYCRSLVGRDERACTKCGSARDANAGPVQLGREYHSGGGSKLALLDERSTKGSDNVVAFWKKRAKETENMSKEALEVGHRMVTAKRRASNALVALKALGATAGGAPVVGAKAPKKRKGSFFGMDMPLEGSEDPLVKVATEDEEVSMEEFLRGDTSSSSDSADDNSDDECGTDADGLLVDKAIVPPLPEMWNKFGF